MKADCAQCRPPKKNDINSGASLLSTFLIILIPKCPFCLMAYSSAITMCGGKPIYMSQNNWISYIPLFLGVVIVLLLVKNFRDTRSLLAICIAVMATLFLAGVHQMILLPIFYNIGVSLLFFAIWLNGSFLSFVANLSNRIKRRSSSWQV